MYLKVIPGPKEPLPTISASPENIVKISHLVARDVANFTSFRLEGLQAGQGVLVAATGTPRSFLPGHIDIIVEELLKLPAAGTTAGLLARIFLAEAPLPDDSSYTTTEDVKIAMTWMRVVLENRLAHPSSKWGSAGAKSLTDVVRSAGQFASFETYPDLPGDLQSRIDSAVQIANDGGDSRRTRFNAHVKAALAVAALPNVVDPCPGGLYWWRTTGSGKPSSTVTLYMSKAGNTFFFP